MNANRRPTIKQVAKVAGVSTQTVSRVINDRPDVALETRTRVRLVIDELGYQPSALARSLIQQRSYTLGVVTAGLRETGPSRTLNGITSAVHEVGENRNWIHNQTFDLNIPVVYLTMKPMENLTVVSVDDDLGGKIA